MDIVIFILIALEVSPSICISTHHVRAVSPRDYYRNVPQPPDKTNWEVGLKEAAFQALIREQVHDPRLKEGIFNSNIEGFQDNATPFGDIAVIARGQLYSVNHGYQFVQDPYENDCDDCHTPHRCDRRQCEPQVHSNLDKLIALWTVKRIRHRDPNSGHRYELQYTISPMSPVANPEFVARNGRFDYSVPGHVFIVKLKENGDKNNFRFDKEQKSSNNNEFKIVPWRHHELTDYQNDKASTENHYHHTQNSISENRDYYIPPKEKTTTEHVFNPGFLIGISPNGYKHIIHDIPGFDRPYIDEKRYRPQENTPKEPVKHLHHHYYIPEVTDIDLDKKDSPTLLTTRDFTYKPVYTTTENVQKIYVPQTSPKQVYTQQTTQAQIVPSTQQLIPLTTQGLNYNTYKYSDTTVPITINPTPFGTDQNYPKTTVLKVFTIPASSPTYSTPFSPSPLYIQYSEPDPIYNNNQPPTVPTYIPQTISPTFHPTVPTYVTIQDQPKTATFVDIYDGYDSTQATTPIPATTKQQKYPDSINAQLPPPDRTSGTDTTIPYVASTALTIVSTNGVTEQTVQDKQQTDGKDSEKKASTIQENIHTSTPIYDEETITARHTTRNKIMNTTPYEAVTTETYYTEESTTKTAATTMKRKEDKDSDDIFEVVHIPKRPKPKVTPQDIDIFGETKKPSTTAKPVLRERPNPFDDIFSDFKTSTENSRRVLTPHSQLSINKTDALRNARISKYLKYKRNKGNRYGANRFSSTISSVEKQNGTENNTETMEEGKDDVETKTSQSYITSISFKVNKNKNKTIDEKDEISKIHNQTTTDRMQTFDDIAQTLVNHARIASYLNSKSTKPTRRSYRPNFKER